MEENKQNFDSSENDLKEAANAEEARTTNEAIVEDESNAAKRIRLLGIDPNEKIHSEEDEIKKGNVLANVWYRYKWPIIIGAFFLIVAIFFIVFIAVQEDYDITVAYAGPAYLNDDASIVNITSGFESLGKDYDDDGESNVHFFATTILTEDEMYNEDGEKIGSYERGQNKANFDNFAKQIMSGEFSVVLADYEIYKALALDGKCRNVKELMGEDFPDELLYDDYTVFFKKTNFGTLPFFNDLPDDTVMFLLVKTAFMTDKEYASCVDYFKTILVS